MSVTTILPTSRAIRSHLLSEQGHDGFLSKYLAIGEFLQRIIRVDGYSKIDADQRTLLLLEAADFNNFSKLQIERNFFTFTENANYLFRFFEELSGELVEIDQLEFADTYGEYEEHITIMHELYQRYEKLCQEKKVLDTIFVPKHCQLNHAYIKSLGSVELHALGYLTNFELNLLFQCAAIIPVTINYTANKFNSKLTQKFRDLGCAVEEGYVQRIHLDTLVVEKGNIFEEQIDAEVESFSQSLLQVGFVKQKVYEMTQTGLKPEEIVVVLPDESFAEHLRRHDTENNFNFAMGIPLVQSLFVSSLEAVMQYIENSTVENSARLNRVGAELYEKLLPFYHARIDGLEFSLLMEPFLEKEHDQAVVELVKEELYYFEKIIPVLEGATLKSVLHLFSKRIKAKSVDDVRGGKITVMGVLETRLVSYKGVIVVNFNEGVVPRKSEKDLFLNSQTRHNAGLPTTSEREDLQKLYYHALFTQASQVKIAYVSSSDAVPSRFLTQLSLPLATAQNDAHYAPIVMPLKHYEKVAQEEMAGEYDFTKQRLSATGLKTFLSCKRKFYHKYVAGIKNHEILKDMPQEHEVGSALHEALQKVYEEQNGFDDIALLRKAVAKALKDSGGNSVLDRYLHKLWMQKLEPFFETEIRRFKEVRVHSCEQKLEAVVQGIKLYGVIDRIDATVEGFEVLDYKSGKYKTYTKRTLEGATDFQLEFYYLLASTLGTVEQCGFYDLNKGQIVYEPIMNEKLEKLEGILETLVTEKHHKFEMTEKLTECGYCEYAYLCQRGGVQ